MNLFMGPVDDYVTAKYLLQSPKSNTVKACVFAPHGKTIVSASWDKTLKVWDLKLGTCTTLEGHRYLCLFCAIAVGKTVKVTILPAALPRSPGERRREVN